MLEIKVAMEQVKQLQDKDFSLPETQREAFSLLESLFGIIIAQQQEVQELRDEINRLKGEQGKPKFGPKKPDTKASEIKKAKIEPKKPWAKSSKRGKIKIDRTEIIKINTSELPPDVVFKGY